MLYNEVAWRLGSVAVFDSVESFAETICAHHLGDAAPESREPHSHEVAAKVKSARATKEHHHVHIGAGRIGLGLALPVFASSTALAIIARDSKTWEGLSGAGEHVEVHADTFSASVRVVRASDSSCLDVIRDWRDGGGHVLVLASF